MPSAPKMPKFKQLKAPKMPKIQAPKMPKIKGFNNPLKMFR